MTRAIDNLRAIDWKPLIGAEYFRNLPLYKVSEAPSDVDFRINGSS